LRGAAVQNSADRGSRRNPGATRSRAVFFSTPLPPPTDRGHQESYLLGLPGRWPPYPLLPSPSQGRQPKRSRKIRGVLTKERRRARRGGGVPRSPSRGRGPPSRIPCARRQPPGSRRDPGAPDGAVPARAARAARWHCATLRLAQASGAADGGARAAYALAPHAHAGQGAPRPPETLRHSCISSLLSRGGPLLCVAQQSGHSPRVMLASYARWQEQGAKAVTQPDATQPQPVPRLATLNSAS